MSQVQRGTCRGLTRAPGAARSWPLGLGGRGSSCSRSPDGKGQNPGAGQLLQQAA